MLLLVGLGNPEPAYKKTRHNVGELALRAIFDAAENRLQPFVFEPGFRGEITKAKVGREQLLGLFPHTYMNNSGAAVQLMLQYYHLQPEKLWVLHDDIDIPFGEVRIQYDRSAAGHNGVRSIIETLGSQAFWRFRIGIKPTAELQRAALLDFVLQNFSKAETKVLPPIAKLVADAALAAARNGIAVTRLSLPKVTPKK